MDALKVALVAALCCGCLGGPSELERRAEAYGEVEDEGPEHMPGEPCLVCHSEASDRGDEIFAVAGTVYLRAEDAEGLGGALVTITDAEGRSFTVETNRAGNFMVEEVPGEGGFLDNGEGEATVGWELAWPLTTSIQHGAIEVDMETPIRLEGSCNECHASEASETSIGRIVVMEP